MANYTTTGTTRPPSTAAGMTKEQAAAQAQGQTVDGFDPNSYLAGMDQKAAAGLSFWVTPPTYNQTRTGTHGEAERNLGGDVRGEGTTFESAHFVSVADALTGLYGLDEDSLKDLQVRLHDAGVLSAYTPGVLDDNTMKAATQLMVEAARSKGPDGKWHPGVTKTFEDVLADHAKSNTGSGHGMAATITVSDPHELAVLFRKSGQELLGHVPTPEETTKFINLVQQAQRVQQNKSNLNSFQVQQANEAGTGGGLSTVEEQQVDPASIAEDQIRAAHPGEVGAHDMVSGYNVLDRLLRGGG